MRLTSDEEFEFWFLDVLAFTGLISDTDYRHYVELHKKRHQQMYIIVIQLEDKRTQVVVTTDPIRMSSKITPEMVKIADETGMYEGDNFGLAKEGVWAK